MLSPEFHAFPLIFVLLLLLVVAVLWLLLALQLLRAWEVYTYPEIQLADANKNKE